MDYDLLPGTSCYWLLLIKCQGTTVLLDGKQRQTTGDEICISRSSLMIHQCSGVDDDDDGRLFELQYQNYTTKMAYTVPV